MRDDEEPAAADDVEDVDPDLEPVPRSVMRELLTPDEIRHLEVAEGRWFLPGLPP
jgi:hypothetical protein